MRAGAEQLLLELVLRHCPPSKTLDVGCGTSRLPLMLRGAGYQPVIAIDISEVVALNFC